MTEILARERSQRYEQEIANRERIKKLKSQRRARLNLSAIGKKLGDSIRSRSSSGEQITETLRPQKKVKSSARSG
jgi:hypothetical protein